MPDIPLADIRGFVLGHEHLVIDYRQAYGEAADWNDDLRARATNMLNALAELGCAGIVDCTPPGYGRNMSELRAAAARTGVAVIAATGSFCEQWAPLPPLVTAADIDGLARYFTSEVADAEAAGTAMVIKAATSAGRITAAEERVLRAAGRAARRTGARIVSHTSGGMGPESLDIYIAEGAKPSQVLISHVGSHGEPPEYAEEIARRGAYVGLDRLGHEDPGDDAYLAIIRRLAAQRRLGQVILSHDSVQAFTGPAAIAGHTFDDPTYLARSFVRSLLTAGFDAAAVRLLTVENPRHWLRLEGTPSRA